ncbi:Beta-barrel assembly machine subunit BamD [Geothermobacter ehrlichii]|uniref:Beta-barrel assembly machine subunit BamD n=1 Tax=Geothermobacter ehrlichii TaxID=213224 RepID=A0A5D3WHE9_9BACT|nr:outer membrane protein assembly factor BamD [Geothermobacter ehrlichii]TYO98279.1 Beta-barrel assembly machine subunit BamD [Geothermobacter ehrlichii]
MRTLLAVLTALCLLAACARPVVPPPKTAAYYLQEGEKMFDRGLFEEAIANWEKVRESYYSPELNIIAELKIAEAYFLAEKYPEAAAAYEDFLKQHPNSDRVSQALYQLGLSYFRQMLPADRDQTATRSALATFRNLVKRFPDDPHLEEVKVYIGRCEDRLAEHEVYVAKWYLKTGKPKAAIDRLEAMFRTYPNYFYRDEAWLCLGKAYLLTGQKEKAVKAFNTLFREFPSSPFIIEAQKFMEKHY